MARIFITGSTTGLGLAAARELTHGGHEVFLHARSQERAESLGPIAKEAAGVFIGDLSSDAQTRELARQVNQAGRMNAVIHNAGVFQAVAHSTGSGEHALTLAVNTLAPYLLTALMERPDRLVYLSSAMHLGVRASLSDMQWAERPWNAVKAYSESKLFVTALSLAVARRWPEVLSNAVDPGWVPTRMGGTEATDELRLGHTTQTWLAVSSDPAALSSGGYWYHRTRRQPAGQALDRGFQDCMLAQLAGLTGISLP